MNQSGAGTTGPILYARAAELANQGDWSGTLAVLEPLLQSGRRAEVLLLAAWAMLRLDRYAEARTLVLEASTGNLPDARTFMQCVRLLRRLEEPAALERLAGSVEWSGVTELPVLAELGLLLGSANLFEPAHAAIDRMLELQPQNADAWYLRGLFAMFAGDREASLAALEQALSIEPRMPNAHWLVAMQGDASTAAAHVEQINRVFHGVVPGTEAQAYLLYSLHHRMHSLGRFEVAWKVLERGMAVQRRHAGYSRERQAAVFDALKRARLPVPPAEPRDPGRTGLIFIVGMFRSGTSLIERVVTRHPDVADGGETYQFAAAMRQATGHDSLDAVDASIIERAPMADFDQVRARMQSYADWRAGGRPWLTEKLPSNFLNIGFILRALPDARILHLRRDPMDTCFSNLRTILRGGAAYASDQSDLADFYLRYDDLMAHWHATAPGRILDVDYASFVADPEGQARRILAYCGLDFDARVLDVDKGQGQVATASAAHVRQGILKDRGGAWKPYEAHLGPLMEGLAQGL